MDTEQLLKDMMEVAKMPSKDWDDGGDSIDDYNPPKFRRDRGSIARDEEMVDLLRELVRATGRNTELLEMLVKNQSVALAKVMGSQAPVQATSSLEAPLNPPRPKLDKQ